MDFFAAVLYWVKFKHRFSFRFMEFVPYNLQVAIVTWEVSVPGKLVITSFT